MAVTETAIQSLLDEERRSWRKGGLVGAVVVLAILVSAAGTGLLDTRRLAEGLLAIGVLFGEMFPPDFTNLRSWLMPVVDTLAMSIAGTALAVALSLPLAFLAAPNTAPNLTVYHAARGMLNLLRSIPELIMGIIFVAAVGFGPLPGVLALGVHSVGMVGKFFAEAIEHVDDKPIEAAQAAGADHAHHRRGAEVVLPAIDGDVGELRQDLRQDGVLDDLERGRAGGIGLELMSSLRLMQYSEVSAVLIVILAMVTVVDSIGAALRKGLK